ncbi:MAG: RluA family pseudouridine synthase [Candidatus Saccharimonadales bacterium]
MASHIVKEPQKRLDQYVTEQYQDLSRASASKLIAGGKVKVNKEVQLKSGYKLRPKDKIKVDYKPDELPPIPKIKLKVLYEDDDCVVIEKPVGLLTHSKGVFNPEATVETWLHDRVSGLEGERAGIVHRLDRATSGVMICAKNSEALHKLQKQFSLRKVKKSYVAIVQGTFELPEAIIDMPIERHPKKPQTFRVGNNGKDALTRYKVLKSNDTTTLLELHPTTGRTHQLRVHLAHIKHPILGDSLYNGPIADRLYLHAHTLEITTPSGERKTFISKVPKDFTL